MTVSDPPTRAVRTDPSLEALLVRVADGDESALRSVYERTSPLIWGLVTRIVRDRGEAEDTLTDVYVQVWRQAGRFDPGTAPALAWITMLARTRAIDRWRSQGRREGRELALDETRLLDPDPSPSERSNGRERAQHVRRAVAALPDEQRRLIEAAFFSGLTHTELAEAFRQPLGTVKTRIRAGLATLRDALAAWQGEHA